MRQPAVAELFYPGTPDALNHTVQALLPKTNRQTEQQPACAVVSPHAGYIYSGSLAAQTICSVIIPETVLIIGPNHHGLGAPAALSREHWQMPSGTVTNNLELGERLLKHSRIVEADEAAHTKEHSLEVQLPFLQARQSNLSIVPLVLSRLSYSLCQELAQSIASAIADYQKEVLILASTDMSHYQSRSTASNDDAEAIQAIEAMDPSRLYSTVFNKKISMCGVIPVVVTLLASQILGARSSRLIGYTDSGYVSGDTAQVVGYAGIVIDW